MHLKKFHLPLLITLLLQFLKFSHQSDPIEKQLFYSHKKQNDSIIYQYPVDPRECKLLSSFKLSAFLCPKSINVITTDSLMDGESNSIYAPFSILQKIQDAVITDDLLLFLSRSHLHFQRLTFFQPEDFISWRLQYDEPTYEIRSLQIIHLLEQKYTVAVFGDNNETIYMHTFYLDLQNQYFLLPSQQIKIMKFQQVSGNFQNVNYLFNQITGKSDVLMVFNQEIMFLQITQELKIVNMNIYNYTHFRVQRGFQIEKADIMNNYFALLFADERSEFLLNQEENIYNSGDLQSLRIFRYQEYSKEIEGLCEIDISEMEIQKISFWFVNIDSKKRLFIVSDLKNNQLKTYAIYSYEEEFILPICFLLNNGGEAGQEFLFNGSEKIPKFGEFGTLIKKKYVHLKEDGNSQSIFKSFLYLSHNSNETQNFSFLLFPFCPPLSQMYQENKKLKNSTLVINTQIGCQMCDKQYYTTDINSLECLPIDDQYLNYSNPLCTVPTPFQIINQNYNECLNNTEVSKNLCSKCSVYTNLAYCLDNNWNNNTSIEEEEQKSTNLLLNDENVTQKLDEFNEQVSQIKNKNLPNTFSNSSQSDFSIEESNSIQNQILKNYKYQNRGVFPLSYMSTTSQYGVCVLDCNNRLNSNTQINSTTTSITVDPSESRILFENNSVQNPITSTIFTAKNEECIQESESSDYENHCARYHDCFNCSSSNYCDWRGNQCLKITNIPVQDSSNMNLNDISDTDEISKEIKTSGIYSETLQIYKKYNSCNYPPICRFDTYTDKIANTTENMQEHYVYEKTKGEFRLQNSDMSFAEENTLCSWMAQTNNTEEYLFYIETGDNFVIKGQSIDVDISLCLGTDEDITKQTSCEIFSLLTFVSNKDDKVFQTKTQNFRINLMFKQSKFINPKQFKIVYISLQEYMSEQQREMLFIFGYVLSCIIGISLICLCCRHAMVEYLERRFGIDFRETITYSENEQKKIFQKLIRGNQIKVQILSNSFNLDFEQLECPFCLQRFVKDHQIVILGCQHCFHFDCFQAWIIKQRRLLRCAMCQRPLDGPAVSGHSSHLSVNENNIIPQQNTNIINIHNQNVVQVVINQFIPIENNNNNINIFDNSAVDNLNVNVYTESKEVGDSDQLVQKKENQEQNLNVSFKEEKKDDKFTDQKSQRIKNKIQESEYRIKKMRKSSGQINKGIQKRIEQVEIVQRKDKNIGPRIKLEEEQEEEA